MIFDTTVVFEKNLKAYLGGKRRALNEGGSSSTKTYSILQMLILIAMYAPRPMLISVVSETFPHLRKGAIRDFFNILGESENNNPNYNKTDHIYTFGKGKIEFFSADSSDKVRGPRRQILYINEPNNGVTYDTFSSLDMRTEIFTVMDWNPAGEFWVHEKGMISQAENEYIHSTFKDGIGVVPEAYIKNILALKDRDPNGWHVYGLGLLGKIEGLVYPFFDQVDALPAGDTFYGLDFGYTDPVALVKCVVIGKALYCQELIYETGLTNEDLLKRFDTLGILKNHDEIFADSAEPKSIEEIHRAGYNIKPAPKGEDSVDFGHKKIREYKQHWTKDSLNCIKEQRNFRYITDKNGKITDKTTHTWSHGMDARRYGLVGKLFGVPQHDPLRIG